MAFVNEVLTLVAALGEIPGVERVTRGWPKRFEKLPCIAVSLAGNAAADWRDDTRYTTELEYYLRIFADQAAQTDGLCNEVDTVMTGLGYDCTFHWEDDSAEVRQTVMRYRKYC